MAPVLSVKIAEQRLVARNLEHTQAQRRFWILRGELLYSWYQRFGSFTTRCGTSMKTLLAVGVAIVFCISSTAWACGPDGKCVGKEKASCCLSKSSAKKSSCSVKHGSHEAKLERPSNDKTPARVEAAAPIEASAETIKADGQAAQQETPKR